jgi:hypothetical protein
MPRKGQQGFALRDAGDPDKTPTPRASADWNLPVTLRTGRQDQVLPFALEYLSNVCIDWFPTFRGLLPTFYAFCLRVGKSYVLLNQEMLV